MEERIVDTMKRKSENKRKRRNDGSGTNQPRKQRNVESKNEEMGKRGTKVTRKQANYGKP
jgi:hypothetical protein